jgi:hypothetical protein
MLARRVASQLRPWLAASTDSPEGRRRLVGDTGYLALRDIEMVRAAPSSAVGAWMSGDIHGPQVRVYDAVDYAGWLASEASEWMGHEMRAELLAGIAARGGWTDWDDSHERSLVTEQLLKSLNDRHDDPGLLKVVLPILTRRLGDTAKTLRLPETGDELAARLLAAGFVEKYKPAVDERSQAKPNPPGTASSAVRAPASTWKPPTSSMASGGHRRTPAGGHNDTR